MGPHVMCTRPTGEAMAILQSIAYVFVTASTCALVAVGLSLTARTARFFNFAQGATFTIGAYLTYLCQVQFKIGILLAVLIAAAGGGMLGLLMELGVFRHVRRRDGSPLVLLLCSLGLYVVLQNMVSMIWGDQLRTPRPSHFYSELTLAGIHLTGFQILTILGAVVLSAFVTLALYRSLFGKAIRAVASDLELSRTVGVNPDSVILSVLVFSSVLAAFAGALGGLDLSLTPTMGMGPLLTGMAAVIIGGKRPVVGVLVASLALGITKALAVWLFGSRWQESIAFFILMAVLLLQPLRRDQKSVSPVGS